MYPVPPPYTLGDVDPWTPSYSIVAVVVVVVAAMVVAVVVAPRYMRGVRGGSARCAYSGSLENSVP